MPNVIELPLRHSPFGGASESFNHKSVRKMLAVCPNREDVRGFQWPTRNAPRCDNQHHAGSFLPQGHWHRHQGSQHLQFRESHFFPVVPTPSVSKALWQQQLPWGGSHSAAPQQRISPPSFAEPVPHHRASSKSRNRSRSNSGSSSGSSGDCSSNCRTTNSGAQNIGGGGSGEVSDMKWKTENFHSNSWCPAPRPRKPEKRSRGDRKFKTKMCRFLEMHGDCPHKDACCFAHHPSELRKEVEDKRRKTRPCMYFFQDGYCPFGAQCHFLHTLKDQKLSEKGRELAEFMKFKRSKRLSVFEELEGLQEIVPEVQEDSFAAFAAF